MFEYYIFVRHEIAEPASAYSNLLNATKHHDFNYHHFTGPPPCVVNISGSLAYELRETKAPSCSGANTLRGISHPKD